MKITLKELNCGYKYTTKNKEITLYKENNIYCIIGFIKNKGHFYETFNKLSEAKKLFISLN